MPLTTYSCPKCGHSLQALPHSDVWHRCPAANKRDVKLTAEPDNADS